MSEIKIFIQLNYGINLENKFIFDRIIIKTLKNIFQIKNYDNMYAYHYMRVHTFYIYFFWINNI